MNITKDILQINIVPSQADEIGRALWQLIETRNKLLEALHSLEEQMLEWRPDDEANNVGSLLYHIALIELDWLFVEVLERPFPPELKAIFPWEDRERNGRLTNITNESIHSHLKRLETIRQVLLDEFSTMSIDDFRQLRSFEPYDVTPEWVLFHLMEHETEHRGHIQELMRQYKINHKSNETI